MKEDYFKLGYSGATIQSILDKVYRAGAGALLTTDDTTNWITIADDQTIEGQKTFLSPVIIDNGETTYNKKYTSFSPLEWKMHSNEGSRDLVTITPGSLRITYERIPHFFEIAIDSSDRVAHISHGANAQYTATLPEKTGTLAMTDDLYAEINALSGSATTGQDEYTSAQYIRFVPATSSQGDILMDESKNLIKVNLSNVPDAPARYIWFKRNTTVQKTIGNTGYTIYQFSAGGEQFWYDNFPTDVAIKDIGNAAMVYVPAFSSSVGYCYITYASVSLPDLNAIANLNIGNGTGTKSVQMKQDGTSGTFDFTGKNPNATAADSTLTGDIAYGGTGAFATVFGGKAAAMGKRSLAQGTTTIAKGNYSHAEGDNSVALGDDSHAEGYATLSQGIISHSEGNQTIARGVSSHSEGHSSKAQGYVSHAEGQTTEANGSFAHSEGYETKAIGDVSHAEGHSNIAGEITRGWSDLASSETVTKTISGTGTIAVVGAYTDSSHQITTTISGRDIVATISPAPTESNKVLFYVNYTVDGEQPGPTPGPTESAINQGGHAEGYNSQTFLSFSHAEGDSTLALGYASHAEGEDTIALGFDSHAEGLGTTARNYCQHVSGRYNNNKTNTLFEVGNGSTATSRSNAFEVYEDGHAEIGLMGSTTNSVATKGYVDSNASTKLYEHNLILSIDNPSPGTGSSYCISIKLIDTTSTPYADGLALFTALYNAGYRTSTSFITASGSCIVGTGGVPQYTGNVIGLYCTGSTTYATLMYVTTGTLSGTDFIIANKTNSFDTSTCAGPNTHPTVIDFVRALN